MSWQAQSGGGRLQVMVEQDGPFGGAPRLPDVLRPAEIWR